MSLEMSEQQERECALCGTHLPPGTVISICNECIKTADCCVGLEKLKD